jgi:hypothetical protein
MGTPVAGSIQKQSNSLPTKLRGEFPVKAFAILLSLFALALGFSGCVAETNNSNQPGSQASTSVSPASPPEPTGASLSEVAVTFPVLDAFFASGDEFRKELQTKAELTDHQVEKLRNAAREETARLREDTSGDYDGSTTAARQLARQRVEGIVGAQKALRVFEVVREKWGAAGPENATAAEEALPTTPNSVPKDTRIVVNSPAYRMDVFQNGQLIKSYKIGIGYPEFPLPIGLRKASVIIFNPTWTPPDEPWVESPNSKVKVGQKIEAGSKLNPLGVLKIPIGLPSLIHGGKSLAKLGTFASHGCVGLTDPLAQDFAKVLARIGGSSLSDAEIAAFKRNRSETKQVKLAEPVPVELRYETIVAEDGKLHVYRDVYELNTNTEEKLRAVLEANGVKLEDLSETERTQVMEALELMATNAAGKPADGNTKPGPSPKAKTSSGRVTRSVKGRKEVVIQIASLKGKGYPAMAADVSRNKST